MAPAHDGGTAAPTGHAPGAWDPSLGELSLPAAAVRRIARSAAPEVSFNSEAIAALNRVAQAYICYVTDCALREAKVDADKAQKKTAGGKSKAGGAATARKTLGADHIMRFLSAQLPTVGKRVATLLPFHVPAEYKPAGIRLLEQVQEQEKAAAAHASAAHAEPAEPRGDLAPEEGTRLLFQSFGAAAACKGPTLPEAGQPPFQRCGGFDPEEDAQLPFMEEMETVVEPGSTMNGPVASAEATHRPLARKLKQKRGSEEVDLATKKRAKASEGGHPAKEKPKASEGGLAAKKLAKAPAAAPLERFFGRPAPHSAEAPVETTTRATGPLGLAASGPVEAVQDQDAVAEAQAGTAQPVEASA